MGILETGDPGCVPVKGAEGDVASTIGRVGVAAFDAEIQFRNPGKSGDVQAGDPGRNVGSNERRDFVMFRETLSVEGGFIAEARNPITKIQTRAARSWLVGSAGVCIAGRDRTSQESMQR